MRFSVAIAVSVVAHLLVGLGLWLYLECVPVPDVSASLDLSSVELSFAEEEDETAAVVPQLSTPEVQKPKEEPPPVPEIETPPNPIPKVQDAVDIPKPLEKPQLLETPQPSSQQTISAPAPKQARIDAPPRPKRTIKPDYPKGSRQRGEQGDVVVEMLVNSQGNVDKVDIITSSGFPELDEAALRAVRAAKFTPAKSGRDSVASTARITLTFKLK